MDPSINQIAADIVKAALAAGQLKTIAEGASLQAGEIASAFKIIRQAVASEIPPGP